VAEIANISSLIVATNVLRRHKPPLTKARKRKRRNQQTPRLAAKYRFQIIFEPRAENAVPGSTRITALAESALILIGSLRAKATILNAEARARLPRQKHRLAKFIRRQIIQMRSP